MLTPTPLHFRELRLSFGRRAILRDLALSLPSGHCTLLCGDNGAGKSTLLRILAGLERPDHALVDLGNGALTWRRCRKGLQQQVVYLHQTPYMFDRSVEHNLAYALPRGLVRDERRARIEQALDWAELEAVRAEPARQLSGGECQRVALARAWLRRPRALLLDEPTANLDRVARQRTGELLQRLKREGMALLVASHDPNHFGALVDNVLYLADAQFGRVPDHYAEVEPQPNAVATKRHTPPSASATDGGLAAMSSANPEAPPPAKPTASPPVNPPQAGDRFPLAVLTRYLPTPDIAWSDGRWTVDAVVAGAATQVEARTDAELQPRQVKDQQWLWPGLEVSLFVDEAESYYMNLIAERPRVFLVCANEPGGRLKPLLATLSFDEAAAYEEGDQLVTDAPMPPEVYQWLEAFVLANYVPEKRRKRKRDNWKQDAKRGR